MRLESLGDTGPTKEARLDDLDLSRGELEEMERSPRYDLILLPGEGEGGGWELSSTEEKDS